MTENDNAKTPVDPDGYPANPFGCPVCGKHDRIMAAPENYLRCNRCEKSFPRQITTEGKAGRT